MILMNELGFYFFKLDLSSDEVRKNKYVLFNSNIQHVYFDCYVDNPKFLDGPDDHLLLFTTSYNSGHIFDIESQLITDFKVQFK